MGHSTMPLGKATNPEQDEMKRWFRRILRETIGARHALTCRISKSATFAGGRKVKNVADAIYPQCLEGCTEKNLSSLGRPGRGTHYKDGTLGMKSHIMRNAP